MSLGSLSTLVASLLAAQASTQPLVQTSTPTPLQPSSTRPSIETSVQSYTQNSTQSSALASAEAAAANIPIYPVTNVDEQAHTGYFSDPFHVVYKNTQDLYIAGTTHEYLKCSGGHVSPKCASNHDHVSITYDSNLKQEADSHGTTICGAAGIHPFQSNDGSWDALVTLHVQDHPHCGGISGGWSVIIHAHPENPGRAALPPTSWIGDKAMIGDFKTAVDANYDGKYFQTPSGELYLIYQKHHSQPKRVGIVAWPMNDPKTLKPGSNPTNLLFPDDGLNSEDYVHGNNDFKLIETGNIHAINGKFLMAYSAGSFNRKTYKIGIAYSDTFLPEHGKQYRKVMKDNPGHLYGSPGNKEVYYLLQAEVKHEGWHYVGDQVLAPGVPTVAQIGPDNSWVVLFAGYKPDDAPTKDDGPTKKFIASYRRPWYARVDVNIPENLKVKDASDEQLQGWITPKHG